MVGFPPGFEAKRHEVEMGQIYFVEGSSPNIILYPGLGDGEDALKHTIEELGEKGINVAGIILDYPDDTEEKILKTLEAATTSAIKAMHGTAENFEPVNLMGISRGGGEALLAAYLLCEDKPQTIGDIAIVSAIGPSNIAMGKTTHERWKTFNRRRKAQQSILNEQLLSDGTSDVMFIPKNANDRGSVGRLRYALSRNDCLNVYTKILNSGHKIYTIFARNDPIFTTHEGESGLAAIKSENHKVLSVEGDHASLSRELGQKQIYFAASLVNS